MIAYFNTCIICNKEYEVHRPRKGAKRSYKSKRPHNSKTCSPKCSKRYNYMPTKRRNELKKEYEKEGKNDGRKRNYI